MCGLRAWRGMVARIKQRTLASREKSLLAFSLEICSHWLQFSRHLASPRLLAATVDRALGTTADFTAGTASTNTPISLDTELIAELRQAFTERQIVILATTVGQVNYWT